ncbi:hypothetical protein A2316_00770 [Candidatus Falkowbacteria bacterium RIFOXYB2_FULL_38_15]|uniref:Uncharacterized protein n=1 Tax=Candidatus Falkowbacteria bacterium RIFOXYA2_FULL_38_12 TaxID=1797993 RepID=A0A1F5S4W1_9BACT|nr:MAG: hypothetical protein A2257_02180 [Candidatus Falkowbacteria bacterium RIFOXYA2_FULL_38_12]OGF32729.1 MAG: hypothetical protein A2316_00770 [Candidatus Falkowbacteria bacterium RIFOXYB2_FULL_38_15]
MKKKLSDGRLNQENSEVRYVKPGNLSDELGKLELDDVVRGGLPDELEEVRSGELDEILKNVDRKK